MLETQSSDTMSTSLLRLAALGRKYPERCFINLNQYLTKELLYAAYHRTRKDGAVGVDGQTAAEYAVALEDNLESLLARAKSGRYVAPPVKRGYVPKGTGQRPIGIPTFEDKVLQRAVVLILEKLYEPIFHPHSFGYRPGRSAHQALGLLHRQLSASGGGHVVEMDIQGFFDHLDKRRLREFLQQRIGDGVILRLINKWLKAGVMEAGSVHYPEQELPVAASGSSWHRSGCDGAGSTFMTISSVIAKIRRATWAAYQMHNQRGSSLTKLSVSRIEDMGQAVFGAGLMAQHIETGPLNAHLAFIETGRMVCSTGLLGSKILLSGTLSETDITLGVGLRITEGSRQWLRSIDSGTVGVFLPGDEHHALYMPGSLYLALTLSKEILAEEAEQLELLVDPEKLTTGHHERKLPNEVLMSLFTDVIDLHHNEYSRRHSQKIANISLEIVVSHLARRPGPSCRVAPLRRLGQVARRALDYIESNLQEDISVDQIAMAAGTSRRTLHRAFEKVLNDTPNGYTARRKLHEIRARLRSCPELSVTQAAAEFSVLELGRLAARYRHQFGETPSKTRHDAKKV